MVVEPLAPDASPIRALRHFKVAAIAAFAAGGCAEIKVSRWIHFEAAPTFPRGQATGRLVQDSRTSRIGREVAEMENAPEGEP